MSIYDEIGGASPRTTSPRYANPTNRTKTPFVLPKTDMSPPAVTRIDLDLDIPPERGSLDPTIVVDKNNPFADMMQAKTDLIAQAIKLLGPNGNENAQSILKEFSYRELLDVVEDLTPKSAN